MDDSTALRARQNSISANGPLPTGVFSLSRCITLASSSPHSATKPSSTETTSPSVAAFSGSLTAKSGMRSVTSPLSCCSACDTCERNFCMLPSSSRCVELEPSDRSTEPPASPPPAPPPASLPPPPTMLSSMGMKTDESVCSSMRRLGPSLSKPRSSAASRSSYSRRPVLVRMK
eukprot:361875-Chlamydomonas_euryale.AAC.4